MQSSFTVYSTKKLKRVMSLATSLESMMVLGIALISATPQLVMASADELTEIVVTAQKFSENAQDVPIAITAITADSLQSSGVVTANDLTALVAGLTVTSTSNTFQPRLRGVGTSFFGAGIENPVALYVDDVYYASQLMGPTDMSDINQISILKGPQGTLFGRNSTGGVLQLTTLDPEFDFGGQVKTEVDNYRTSRTMAYVTGGITDNIRANLTLKYGTQGKGWGTNLVTGTETHRVKSDIALHTKWIWSPGTNTNIKLNADYEQRKDNMGQNLRIYNAPGITPLSLYTGLGFNGETASNPYDSTNAIDNSNYFKQYGASINADHDLGFAKLVSITAYRKYRYSSASDTNASRELATAALTTLDGDQFSQELQLISKTDGVFRWVAGAYYFNATDKYQPLILNYDFFYANLFYNPNFFDPSNTFFYNSASSVNYIKLTTRSWALFGQGTTNITDNFHLTTGLRYTKERRTISGSNDIFFDGGSVADPIYSAQFTPDQTGSPFKDSQWTWRLALDYNFTSDLMGYLSYNKGYKSGGYNAITGAPQPPYKAETVNAYEAGMKSELFAQTLRLNGSVFYNKYKNIQVLILQGCCLNAVNAADSKIYGVDLDVEWRLTNDFNISGGLEWLHARFANWPQLPYNVPVSAVSGGGIDAYPGSVAPLPARNGQGNSLPFSPNFVGDIALNYTVHTGDSKLLLNVTESYNNGYYYEPENFLKQDSFSKVNAAVTWTSADERISLGVFGRNLTNKVTPIAVSGFAPLGYFSDYSLPPRTYGVNAQYKFGGSH